MLLVLVLVLVFLVLALLVLVLLVPLVPLALSLLLVLVPLVPLALFVLLEPLAPSLAVVTVPFLQPVSFRLPLSYFDVLQGPPRQKSHRWLFAIHFAVSVTCFCCLAKRFPGSDELKPSEDDYNLSPASAHWLPLRWCKGTS